MGTLEAFFYDRIKDSPVGDAEKTYILHFLTQASRWTYDPAKPLALEYMKALDGEGSLKEVGDLALFVTGVLPGTIGGRKKVVHKDYFIGIGSNAYWQYAEQTSIPVYWSLSESFVAISNLVAEASRPPETTEALLDRWERDRDEKDAERLREQGVLVFKR